MRLVANPFVVLLDANVLFPVRTRDILFTFLQLGLFRARFTEEILEEWRRNLCKIRPQHAKSIDRQIGVIRSEFDECFVTGYEGLADHHALPDPDDRHVLAAAIRCSAQIIITENKRDFPEEILEIYGIEVLGADDALTNTYELFPFEATRALRSIREKYQSPTFTRSEFLRDLVRSGLPKLAAAVRPNVDYL